MGRAAIDLLIIRQSSALLECNRGIRASGPDAGFGPRRRSQFGTDALQVGVGRGIRCAALLLLSARARASQRRSADRHACNSGKNLEPPARERNQNGGCNAVPVPELIAPPGPRPNQRSDGTNPMIRVLIIAYSNYVRDGRVKRHAEALAQRGDQVDVICLDDPQLCSANGVHTIGIEMPRYHGPSRLAYVRSYLRFFARAAAMAVRLSRTRPYDAAIVCSIPDAVVLCAAPLRLFGTRIVLDVHDTMPELYRDKFGGRRGLLGAKLLRLEERASAWLADRVIAVHDLHRARLEDAGIPPAKIRVVLNSPDPRIFGAQSCGRHDGGDFVVLCHGTITHRLGLDVAFKALALLDRGRKVRLNVIGRGDYLNEAKNLAAAMNLKERVSFLPAVPIEQLPAMLTQADAGLVPNRPSAATHLMLPVKMMEYAASGIPIIAA